MNMPKIYLLAGCIFLLIMLMGCSLATKPESPANESTANDNCLMEVSPSPMHKGEAVEIVFNFHLTGLYKLVITNVLEQEVISFKVTDSPVFWNGKDKYGQLCKTGVYYITLYSDELVLSRKMLLCV
jgi:hypothetical protein